jgi:hypothetical protein
VSARLQTVCRLLRLSRGRHGTALWRGPSRRQHLASAVRPSVPPPVLDPGMTMPLPMLGVHPEETL